MTRKIIDTPYSVQRLAPALAADGVECVIRYYNQQNSSTFPDKRLTTDEAKAISENGMSIAVVFQQHNRDLADFTPERADADANKALEIAADLNQPAGSAIYFSVDSDFFRPHDLQILRDYFLHIRAVFRAANGDYKIGVYGSGTVARTLLAAGAVDHVWIARAIGWSGSRDFLKTDGWTLYQDAVDLKIQNIDYDTNITRSGVADFGQFRIADSALAGAGVGTTEIAASKTVFEVVARTSLNLRGGPGLEYGIIRSLVPGQRAYGLKRSGDWLQVDLEGDGAADGYLHTDYLRTVVGEIEDVRATGTQPVDIAYQELALQVKELPGPAVNPRIALYYQSLDGQGYQNDTVPWCSYFVNYCFSAAGRRGSGQANARSWLNWGSPVHGNPQRGDVAVFWRNDINGWQGHVGFFIGRQGNDPIILGGNQGDAVSIRPMDASHLLSIRRG